MIIEMSLRYMFRSFWRFYKQTASLFVTDLLTQEIRFATGLRM
jgi:hypothetical protein